MKRHLALTLFCLFTAILLWMIPQAKAEVMCDGYGCDNKDPIAMGCAADAITVASAPIYSNFDGQQIGYVELRWSAACGTNWSRVTRTDGAFAEAMHAVVERSNPYKRVFEVLTGYAQIYSNMVYARYIPARACGLIDQSWISGHNCTDWR